MSDIMHTITLKFIELIIVLSLMKLNSFQDFLYKHEILRSQIMNAKRENGFNCIHTQ